jgi:dienelactone hydrolase
VYLPGWDSTKEQGVGIALALAERGIGTLLCDGPGVGEAVLFRGLVNRHDYEVPGAAAVDYLLSRADLKPPQVGVVGSSLGGYRAARMAAYESRLAAAVVWGAVWDFKRVWEGRRRVGTGVLPTPDEHALHVMGAKDADQVSRLMDGWNLEGLAERIRCPLLILHGEQDTQFPVEDALRLYQEAGSSAKELKLFAPEETGAAHCQNDNRVVAHEYIGDYLVDVLLRGQTRQGIVRGAAACA